MTDALRFFLHRPEAKSYRIQGFGLPPPQQKVTINKHKDKKAPTPAQRAAAAAGGSPLPPDQKQEETLTLAQYFQRTYNKQVNPNLPSVRLGTGNFVPMDLVELLRGNVIPPTKLTSDQAANQIRVAAKKPHEREQQITQIRNSEAYESNRRAQAWGVQVSKDMLKLEGRILNPPKVQYHSGSKKAQPFVSDGSVFVL